MKVRQFDVNLEIRMAVGDFTKITAARKEGKLTTSWCRENGVHFFNTHSELNLLVTLNNVVGYWPLGSIFGNRYIKPEMSGQ